MGSGSWETRSLQAEDEAKIREIILGSFERGDLPDWSRFDAERSVASAPGHRQNLVVGVAEGEVVGFVWPRHHQLFVHPERRRLGHGTRLVEAGLDWMRAHGESKLALAVPVGSEAALGFVTRFGFARDSSLWLLRLPRGQDVPPPVFPPEFVGVTLPREFGLQTYVALINDSFFDHEPPISISVEALERAHASPSFDPGDICLVTPVDAPDRPVAFCRSRVMEDEGKRVGEIALIGVVPGWRGRGLGRALLRWGVAHLRERDVEDLTLTVETKNELALRLYERSGFVRVKEWPRWSKPA